VTDRDPIVVVNCFPMTEARKGRLAAISDRLVLRHHDVGTDYEWSVEDLVDPDVEGLLGFYPPSDLARTPRLRWFQAGSSGVDFLDPAPLLAGGVTVTNGSGVHAVPMGEYALGALLHIAKDVEARQDNQRRHAWPDDQPTLAGRLLRGRTLVVVGYGSIGRETARLASAFGMRIVAVKADPTRHTDDGWVHPGTGDPEGLLPERWAGIDGLVDAVREADYVVAALPGTAASRGAISAAVIDAMPPRAWIVNVGRGSALDTDALIRALREGRIGGSFLDVFEPEPLPADSPLWDLPNSIVTPHVSGGPAELGGLLIELFAEQLRRLAADEPLLNVVDLARGY
jgi:phosphoglycerate dehydrogenase-like enzyme